MIRINLLPVRAEKRKEHVRRHGLLLGCYVAFVIALISVVYLSQKSSAESKRQMIEKQKADIVALDKTIKEVQNYKAKLADLTDKLNVVIGLEQRQRGPARYFGELAKAIPEKVWIEKLTDSNGSLAIDGYAIDQQTIAQFMMNLEASKAFSRVSLKVTKRVAKFNTELQSFSLDARLAASTAPTPLEQAKANIASKVKQGAQPAAAAQAAPVAAPAAPAAKEQAPAQKPASAPAKPVPPPAKPAPKQAPKPAKAG